MSQGHGPDVAEITQYIVGTFDGVDVARDRDIGIYEDTPCSRQSDVEEAALLRSHRLLSGHWIPRVWCLRHQTLNKTCEHDDVGSQTLRLVKAHDPDLRCLYWNLGLSDP